MKSFGIWYISKEDETQTPQFDLHLNFWDLEEVSKKHKAKPFLDIGIKITNYTAVQKLVFYCPFIAKKSEIQDLSYCFETADTAILIFNERCSVVSDGHTKVIKIHREDGDESLLIYTDQDDHGGKFVIEPNTEGSYTEISFALSNYKPKGHNDISTLYIRFRIKAEFNTTFYFDTEPLNKSFESAFSGTRIIDFKINESRNIFRRRLFAMEDNKEQFVEFEKIHLLIMEPSSYQIQAIPDDEMKCREVEEGMWEEYLGGQGRVNDKHVLAYHWTKKSENNKKIPTFARLIKVNYSKARLETIATYILGVLALGIFSSLVVSFLFGIITNPVVAMLACIILFLVLLGLVYWRSFGSRFRKESNG